MKIGLVILLLLVGGICGAAATHFYKEGSLKNARAKAAERQATLDSLLLVVERDSIELAVLRERIDSQRDSLEKLIDASDEALAVVEAESDSLSNYIDGQLPDHLRPAFFRLRIANQERVDLLEGQKVGLSAIVVSQDTLIATYVSVNRTISEALARSEELREYWEDEAKRDWWEKPQFTAPLAVGGTLVVVTVVKAALD